MNKNFSLYLHAVRFCAAMGVFVSHFVIARWTGGAFPKAVSYKIGEFGVDLVMVFFVLSGFVIAYTADVKDRHWRDYAFNRGTRIYSVAIPAIILGFLLDRTGAALNPESYQGWWYAEHSLAELLLRGATFTNEFWIAPFRIGSNGPYWSLGYEVWYYVLFGVALFARGLARLGVFGLILLLAGPGVVLLGGVWLMGVVLYRVMRRDAGRVATGRWPLAAAAGAAVLPVMGFGALRLLGGDDFLYAQGDALAEALGLKQSIGRANLFLWHWVVGALVAVHFYGMAALLGRVHQPVGRVVSSPIRWLAGASFSLYLVHYPLMQALDAVLVGDGANPYRMAFLAAATLIGCFVFAEVFERPLARLRTWIRWAASGARSGAVLPPGE
jgi:peptidoglycan/LPS O-acetylase OafA/YrhL